jgi:hypothetical protein
MKVAEDPASHNVSYCNFFASEEAILKSRYQIDCHTSILRGRGGVNTLIAHHL